MKLDYNSREIFFGNEALIVADMAKGSNGKPEFTNHKIVTGLVSVGEMEDQAETNSYPADDVPDHGVKKGATLLQGEMVFIQTDQALKEDILGQQRTANGLGWSPTGNWKTKCVQYLIKGRKRDKVTGEFIDGYRVVVYPNLRPTAEPTKESETDSVDGVDPIQWTLAVQATDSDIYLNGDKKVPAIEYEIWGEQAKDFVKKMESGLFIMQPDTELVGAVTLVAPVIENVQTKIKGHHDGTILLPATLKNSKGQDVKVTAVIKDVKGNVATNNGLYPGVYIVTFSAEGYADVSVGVAVTVPIGANHVAFSYSADGKDRFMTVYPNLNLLEGTAFKNYIPKVEEHLSMKVKDGGVFNKTYVSSSYDNPELNSYSDILVWTKNKETFKPSTTYTFSFFAKGKGTIKTFIHPSLIDDSNNNSYVDDKLTKLNGNGEYTWTLTNEWALHTYTFTTKSSITEDQYIIFRLLTGNNADICVPKVEQGGIYTPWMPSFSEATDEDYPRYIGIYTDNNSNEQSTDPLKYTWKKYNN